MTDRSSQILDCRLLAAVLLMLAACTGSLKPVPISGADACAHCRMAVSDVHFAAQIVAPGEEPRIFDDIGCLAAALTERSASPGAVVFVADRRTGEWIRAASAVFTRVPQLDTPMGSHIVAHASPESRAADALAARGQPLTYAEVFGAAPGGSK